MTVFVVIPGAPRPNPQLAAAITSSLPGKFHQLPNGEFLVAFSGTSQSLSELLKITDGTNGTAFIASISGYFGRAPTAVWEWITQNWTAT